MYRHHYFEKQWLCSEWDDVRMHRVGYFMLVLQLIVWTDKIIINMMYATRKKTRGITACITGISTHC